MEKKEEPDFSKLNFVRVFTPMHIPKYLIEQLKDRDYSVDEWYEYQKLICMRDTPKGPQLNPLSMLYVIVDEEYKVIGMLWCDTEVLSKSLVIQNFSIDKDYWYKGKAVMMLADKAKEIAKECKLKKIVWFTRYSKHSEYYGFKKSKDILMEYDVEEDPGYGRINKRKRKTDGSGRDSSTSSERISSASPAGDGGTISECSDAVSAAV